MLNSPANLIDTEKVVMICKNMLLPAWHLLIDQISLI